MSYVIQIVGRVDGAPTDYDGQYLQGFDLGPTGHPATLRLDCAADPRHARHYASVGAAFTAWKTVHPAHPLRADGQPNRPLTVFTIMVLTLDDALADA